MQMKITKTFKEIDNFVGASFNWLQQNPDKSDTKFAYALKKVRGKLSKVVDKFNDDFQDNDLEFAATDDKGILLRDERGQFKYTKEDARKRLEAQRKLRDKSVEFEAHFADEPEGLTDDFRDVFTDFVVQGKPEIIERVA